MTLQRVLRPAIVSGLILLGLGACGGDSKDGDKAAPAGGAAGATSDQIEVKDFEFKPEAATVKVGTKVTWIFQDDSDHNVEPVGGAELAKSEDLKNGATYSFTFTKPGEVKYRCGIHNYMTGTVNVTA